MAVGSHCRVGSGAPQRVPFRRRPDPVRSTPLIARTRWDEIHLPLGSSESFGLCRRSSCPASCNARGDARIEALWSCARVIALVRSNSSRRHIFSICRSAWAIASLRRSAGLRLGRPGPPAARSSARRQQGRMQSKPGSGESSMQTCIARASVLAMAIFALPLLSPAASAQLAVSANDGQGRQYRRQECRREGRARDSVTHHRSRQVAAAGDRRGQGRRVGGRRSAERRRLSR